MSSSKNHSKRSQRSSHTPKPFYMFERNAQMTRIKRTIAKEKIEKNNE